MGDPCHSFGMRYDVQFHERSDSVFHILHQRNDTLTVFQPIHKEYKVVPASFNDIISDD